MGFESGKGTAAVASGLKKGLTTAAKGVVKFAKKHPVHAGAGGGFAAMGPVGAAYGAAAGALYKHRGTIKKKVQGYFNQKPVKRVPMRATPSHSSSRRTYDKVGRGGPPKHYKFDRQTSDKVGRDVKTSPKMLAYLKSKYAKR